MQNRWLRGARCAALSPIRTAGLAAAVLLTAPGIATAGRHDNNGGNGCNNTGMCGYAINEEDASLQLTDTPVGYTPPRGPSAEITLSYHQRTQNQPANFDFFNIGPKWTLSWLSYVEDDPGSSGTNVTRYLQNGGLYSYSGFDSRTHAFALQEDDASVLVLASTNPVVYKVFLKDGSIEVYSQSDGSKVFPRLVFLSRIIDPQGNTLTLDYDKIDGRVRLVALTDATGRRTRFSYGSGISPLLLTRITDPFLRSAELTYDGSGRLQSITDTIGLTSRFTYDASSMITSLTTPYGITRFTFGGSGTRLFLNVVDPLGYGEREETFEPASFIPFSEPANRVPTVPQGVYAPYFNAYLIYRNSFHWNKHQYAIAGCTPNGGCNYLDARITHFDHDAANINTEWDTVESFKEPLENRVWYTYPGQPLSGGLGAGESGTFDAPNSIARVLDNGQTQLTQLAYNAAGKPTTLVDPAGRQTSLTYAANQIDILAVEQMTAAGKQTIARYTYNGQHRPLSYTDAAGQTTRYTYNTAGQMTSVTNPLGQKTVFEYNSTGDLVRIINADGKTAASFTYDAFDRVAIESDSEGWQVGYAYDAADRLTKTTYPDGTTEQYTYDRLDLASDKDRQGNVWHYSHDADQRLVAVTDPLGHVTRYGYYEDGTLKSATDPDRHATSWAIDVESRPTAIIYADGTRTTYAYERATSRLLSATDALGQTKAYRYAVDDRLASITHIGALHSTPNVYFTYDADFPRRASMTDGTGTTTYGYVPVGKLGALRLAEESQPSSDSKIVYAYDALGRVAERTVGGEQIDTFAYDRIGRLVDHTDALGKFTLSYLGETGQPTLRQLVGGKVATAWSYLPNRGDRRLVEIDNKFPNERQFHYTTTANDLIAKIVEDKSGSLVQSWGLTYDSDNRLLSVVATSGSKYGYTLDPADNITSFTTPRGTDKATYNVVNEATSLAGKPFVYDADGNLVSDGVRSFSWDAENRLIGITQGGTRVSFAYDGLDRRTAIAVTKSARTALTRYIWCGTQICQARTGTNIPVRLYYPEGEVIPSSKTFLYYGPDQLGSVRDIYAESPVFSMVQAYDYDPYGSATKTPATGPFTDFRYAGMFYNADSGLYLTQFRAYDSRAGRWLSRDPAGEIDGVGLYVYVWDNPIIYSDTLGLKAQGLCYATTHRDPHHWNIHWHLWNPSTTGGYIIQEVTMVNAAGGVTAHYWEAWQVAPGGQNPIPAYTAPDTTNDMFSHPGGPSTYTTDAQFYEGLALPAGFVPGGNPSSGLLPSTNTNPHLPCPKKTAPPVHRVWHCP